MHSTVFGFAHYTRSLNAQYVLNGNKKFCPTYHDRQVIFALACIAADVKLSGKARVSAVPHEAAIQPHIEGGLHALKTQY